MSDRATDPAYLRYQYGDAEKLRVRQETHARYSENDASFLNWVLALLEPAPGQLVLDAGCGPGVYHPLLAARGARVVGVDLFAGMAREARRQVVEGRLAVLIAQAAVESLPLTDAACDRVMANHMLYHVPDQVAALRELRRVLKPGGRIVLATNAADSGAELDAVHGAAAAALGYRAEAGMSGCFTLDDLPLVRRVFPAARVETREDFLRFPNADAALRYYASSGVDRLEELPPDGSHRARLLPLVEAAVAAIIAREGVFRVSKTAGCFVAER